MRKSENLSKRLSFVLRHHPERYRLHLSENGWADLELVARRLGVRRARIEEFGTNQSKRRFEIKDGKIRALYGHTVEVEFATHTREPPGFLYHGTSPRAVSKILAEGLLPMKRRWVHLSETPEDAYLVGLRKDRNPVILQVRAGDATDEVSFHKSGDVWLCKSVPSRYIEALTSFH